MDGITPSSSSDHLFVPGPEVSSGPRINSEPATPSSDFASSESIFKQPVIETNPVPPAPISLTPLTSPSAAPVAPVSVPSQASSQPELQPHTDRVSYSDAQIQEIEVSQVVANPYQPRKVFNQEALQELADSIREHGVIQPLVVTRTPNGYELVVGERRFRASQLAGLTKVPAIIKQQLQDQTKLEVALIENIQRQELNAIEEAQAYDRLIKNFNLTQEQVAKKVGKSRPSVTNTLRLLNLPAEIQRAVIEGKISEGHARAILGLTDIEKQILMYQMVVDQGLNVRQVEGKVRELSARRSVDSVAPDPKLMALESQLRGTLGTQVKISRQGRGGKITIEFFSEEELADLVEKMGETHSADGSSGFLTV